MAAGNFTQALAKVLVHEGGKCDDPRDPGGRTNCGITHIDYDLYRKSKGLPPRDVYDMDNQERDEIYRKRYWDVIEGDTLPSGVDYVLFDGAVNSGPALSVKWLQRSLGGVIVDGELGPATLAAAVNNPDMQRVAKAALQARREFLQQLKTFSVYGKGWIKRVDDVQTVALAWIAGQQLPVIAAIPNAQAKATRTSAVSPPPTAPGDVVAAAAGVGLVTTLAVGSNAVTVVPPPGPADQGPAGAAVIADNPSTTIAPSPAGPVAPPAQIVAPVPPASTAALTNLPPSAPPPLPSAPLPTAAPQPPAPPIAAPAGPTAPNAAPVATAPAAAPSNSAGPDASTGPAVKIDIAPPSEPSVTAQNSTPTVLPDKPATPSPAPVTVPPTPSPGVAVIATPPSAPNPAPGPMPAKPAPPPQASVAVAAKPSPVAIPPKPITATPNSAPGAMTAKPAPALPSHASVAVASKTSQAAVPIPSPRPNPAPGAMPAKPISVPASLTSLVPKSLQGTLAIPSLPRPVIAIPENQLSFIATGMGVLFASGLVLSFSARHAQSKLADALGDTPVPKTLLKFAATTVGTPVAASPGTATPMAVAKKAATRLLAAIWIAGTIVINVIALAKLLQILGVEHMAWHGPFVALGNFYDLYAGRAFAATSTFVFNQVGVTLPIWLMPVLILYVSMASAFVVGGTGIVGRDTSAETFLGAVVHASWILAIPVFVVDAVRYQVVTRFARQNTAIFLAYVMTFAVIYIGARYVNERYMTSPAVAARATAIMMQIGDSAEKKALALKP